MASRRIEAIPLSLDVVRRKVMSVIAAVEKETSLFVDRYLNNEGDTSRWSDFLDALSSKYRKPTDRIDDFKDVEPLIERSRGDPIFSTSIEMSDLRRMVERGKMFDYIAFSLRNDIVDAFDNYLKRYCLSFSAEGNNQKLQTPSLYDERAEKWEESIREKTDSMDAILDEHDRMRSPLKDYIRRYETVQGLMLRACEAMRAVVDPMKRWISHDSTYARRVQEEINMYNRRKMELRDDTKQLEYQRDQQGLRLKRRAMFTLKLEKLLNEAKEEKRYYKRRANTVMDNLNRLDADRRRKEADLDEVKARIRNRKENSPTVYNYLTGMAESLRDDIRKLEKKIAQMSRQGMSLEQEMHKAQRDVDKVLAEVESSRNVHLEATKKVVRQQEDLNLVLDEIGRLDKKILALKKIREIKLHSDTIKKIFHYGYRPGDIMNFEDELQEAFKITSQEMGKDWSFLYQKLPFAPPRDYRERTHDIEVLDLSNRRNSKGGFQLLALKSLEKWRRLSTIACVDELIGTLRRLKRRDTVQRIKKEVLHGASPRSTDPAMAKRIVVETTA